jgi:hypothetical protein
LAEKWPNTPKTAVFAQKPTAARRFLKLLRRFLSELMDCLPARTAKARKKTAMVAVRKDRG